MFRHKTRGLDEIISRMPILNIIHSPLICFAGGEGFEPPEDCSSTVFKTAALVRSANHPY